MQISEFKANLQNKIQQRQPSLGTEEVGKEEASDNIIEQGAMFKLQQAGELSSFSHVSVHSS